MPFNSSSTADEVLADLDLSHRVIWVTGANSGIGFETARALAARGAVVYCACRSIETAEDAADRIRQAHPDADLRPVACDLASLQSVRDAVAAFAEPALHALICNAGVYGGDYTASVDGFERTFAVCHLGHFALAQGMHGKLKAANGARVVWVASGNHMALKQLELDSLPPSESDYTPLRAYNVAKLLNVMMAAETDRRWADDQIRSNSLHPGNLIRTGIERHSWLASVLFRVAQPFSKTVHQGAATTVYVACRPELEGLGGRYFDNCAESTPSSLSRDRELAARVWEQSLHWVAAEPSA